MHTDLVIDADGHCNEPWEDLTPWMPREYHQRAPVGFNDRHGTSRMYVEGRLSTRTEGLGPGVSGPFAPHIKGGRPGERDARQRLPDMDQEGIDVAIIFGTRVALSVNGLRDKELAGVLCHAVNRWLLEEYLPIDPKRLKGVGLIPCQDPPAAVKELEWLIQHRQDGIVSAMLPVQCLRHQPRRPSLRPDLRAGRSRWPAALRPSADRPRRPVRRLGHHGRRLRADGEV